MSVIPKIPRASGALAPLGPLPGFCPGPAEDLKRSPGPSPTHAPLTTNPGSAPATGVLNDASVISNSVILLGLPNAPRNLFPNY